MEDLENFLKNKPIYIPQQGIMKDYLLKMNIKVSDKVIPLLKQVNPYRLGLVSTTQKYFD